MADPAVPGLSRLRRPGLGLPFRAAGALRTQGPVHGRRALRRGCAAGAGAVAADPRSRSRAGRRPRAGALPRSRRVGRDRALELLRPPIPRGGAPDHPLARPLLRRELLQSAAGETLRRYSGPVNLARFDRLRWMTADEDLWEIPNALAEIPHR